MKKKMENIFIKSDIILLFLICCTLTLIILFVDFNKDDNIHYDVNIYKAYYAYDINSSPVSLSYYMINVDKDDDIKIAVKKVFNKIKKNVSDNLELLDVIIRKNEIVLLINEDIRESDDIALECLINSILDIKGIENLLFKYEDIEFNYASTIENYYINSPIVNKLYTFLYRDENYKLVYEDNLGKKIDLIIEESNKNDIIYIFNNESQKWVVKKDGIYKDNEKLLSSTYKVGENWTVKEKNVSISSVAVQEDSSLIITVKVVGEYVETYMLKQGLGIINYEKKDSDGIIIDSYKYVERVFSEE